MRKPFSWYALSSCLSLISLLVGLSVPGGSVSASALGAPVPSVETFASRPWAAGQSTGVTPTIQYDLHHDTSKALRDVSASATRPLSQPAALPLAALPHGAGPQQPGSAANVQRTFGGVQMPSTAANFEGVSNLCGCYPPDTNGDIGYDPATSKRYYVQMINLDYQIWDVTNPASPVSLLGPFANNTFWSGFGGECQTYNNGDPVVLFDEQAHRWMASQFVIPFSAGDSHQCIAISQTADPTGAWYRYDFQTSPSLFIDYPHFGVWPDPTYNAYFMTAHEFNSSGTAYVGQAAFSFERSKMLTGQPAQMVSFNLGTVNLNFGGQLTADLDGAPAPAATPGYFFEVDDTGTVTDTLSIWEFRPNWTTPVSSTFGLAGQPNTILSLNNFISYGGGIPQPGTGQTLASLADRLMHRVSYRNFGSYQSMLLNHTVSDGTGRAGINWIEVRNTGGVWSVNQQGVYAPADGLYRWMGGIAQDVQGNMALGYSVSSSTVFPSIRYTGRLAGDPLNTLPQAEATIISGTGNQTGSAGRWGDYSMMGVDPQDQCTFWYTQEYIQTSGIANWQTRIASFKFPGCSVGPQGTLSGTVSNTATGAPIAGASVQASASPTLTVSALANAAGGYSVLAPVGTYTATVSAFGFSSSTVSGINVLSGTVTTQNFSLSPLPSAVVQGTVTDGSGHLGMPLYAQIDITAAGFARTIFSNPVTGSFSTTLLLNQPYTFVVTALGGGYNVVTTSITATANPFTQNFPLTVNSVTCNAPGYSVAVNGLAENFDGVTAPTLPANWATAQVTGTAGAWFTNVGTHFPAGIPAHSAPNVVYFNSFTSAASSATRLYRTVSINMTTVPTSTLTFWMYHDTGYTGANDSVQVQASTNNGSTWSNFGPAFLRNDGTTGWAQQSVSLATLAHKTSVTLGFLGTSQFGNDVHLDDITLGATCSPIPGGLVAGNVADANTGAAMNGAVVSDGVRSVTSAATPIDPNLGDGFYSLFSGTGTKSITATTTTTGFGSDAHSVVVAANQVVAQNFNLPAGSLAAVPPGLAVTVNLGVTTTASLILSNTGGLAATFQLSERDGGGVIGRPGPGAPLRLIQADHFTPGPLGSKTSSPEPLDPSPSALPWTAIANYPTSIMDNSADQYGGKIYSVGGYNGASVLNSAYVFDPGAGTWSAIASMADAREKPAAAFVNGLLYVAGGWDTFATPDPKLEIFNPATNTWTTGASVPTALAGATAVALNGQLYLIGGCTSTCGFTTVQRYDPASNSWTSLAPYPEATSWEACGPINAKIYCAGGVSSVESLHTYVYDPGANTWSALANMPQTLWAMGYTVAGGLLYLSGGVTNNFATITNQGFVFDPGSNTWTTIANSNNSLYRGASACGFYKIGGSTGGFAPVPNSEVYPGLTNCATSSDVTWLSEVPVSGTVAARGSQPIAVTFDSGVAAVTTPGQYFAQLQIASNTPYPVGSIPVTMTVSAPLTWGKLTGTVTGLTYCDAPGAALRGATVFLQSGTGYTSTLQTDASGAYARWLDQANSPLTVTVSSLGYLTQTLTGISVSAGLTTTQNVNLRLPQPCISVAPTSISNTVGLGARVSVPFTISNSGGGSTGFTLQDTNGGFQPSLIGPYGPVLGGGAVLQRVDGTFFAGSLAAAQAAHIPLGGGAPAPLTSTVPWAGIANYPISIMDNSADQFGGKVYAVGGYNGASNVNSLYIYDPVANTWTAGAAMADIREKPAAGFINGLLYVVGGWDSLGNPDSKLEIYNPATNTWTTGASTPTALAGAGSVVLNGQLYVIGGCTSACGFTTVLRYDPGSNSWTALAPYPETTSWEACGAINGKIYCAGGALSATLASQHTYVYDAGANTWTALASLPQTQWGMGYTVAGGLLYISGGVTNNFATITNQGFVYDPVANTWTAIANSNNTVYRGASACGFYKIGGSSAGFTPLPNSEVLAGLGACGQTTTDAIWLTEAPVTGTVTASTNQPITVTFDASQVQQPGTYLASLSTQTSDPVHGSVAVPVTMTVPAPRGWGQVHGRVYALGYCGTNPQLLPNAAIAIQTSTGITATLTQDAQGDPWAWWAPRGAVTVTVSAANYVTQTLVVQIAAGQGVNRDVNLRWQHNCGSVVPSPVSLTLSPNITTVVPITLANTGPLSWTWSLAMTSTWASVSGPISGTTPADSSLPSALTIKTSGMIAGSTHTALLIVTHNDDHQPSPLAILVSITISNVRGVTVTPASAAKAAVAGQVVTYTLAVKNTGYTSDSFTISLGSHAWNTVAPLSIGPLDSGASATISIVTTVAAGGSNSDAVVVTATSAGDATRQANATLTTSRTG